MFSTTKARNCKRNISYSFQRGFVAVANFRYLLHAKKAHAKNKEDCEYFQIKVW